ncbi:unnamed protein product [Rhizoctonia solani]|uniref:CHAT domain-containing protein n=1 Tax=Rhizoctonia solani TaxID=456999 RepID=A0A8H3EBT9_9AGAM|nr:unnamed protein product [Rhizoctonia solani]
MDPAFQRDLREIDEEIVSIRRALSWIPDESPGFAPLLICLGIAHSKRFDILEEPNDIHKTIEYITIVLSLASDNDPGLRDVLSTLGSAYGQRFQRLGDMDDINKTIEFKSLALAKTPNDHPDLPRQLSTLAISFKLRFQRLGDLRDVEQAVEYDFQAIAATPEDNIEFPERLENVGTSLFCRFRSLGKLIDLEKAIEYQSRGLAMASNYHPHLPTILANLGASHCARFGQLGNLNDLEKAMEYQARALALTSSGDSVLCTRLTSLGASHCLRFERLGALGDLEKAIEYQSCGLIAAPNDHPHLPLMLANLGLFYTYRFEHWDEINDIERAIEYGSHALTLTSDGHPDLPSWLCNLAMSHKERFRHLNNLSDLEMAIEYETCALAVITDEYPDSCRRHFNHATSYIQYYEYSNDPSHLQEALHSFRIACISSTGAPRDRFQNAHHWAIYASKYNSLNPVEAYQATIDLLPQFVWLGATTHQRYKDLETIQTLAVDAARAAILLSSYSLALEWLEHARCIVWNQNLMLRSPLDKLQVSHPALAVRLQTVAEELHSAGSDSRDLWPAQQLFKEMTLEEASQRHRRLAKEYDELLNQARTLPGFEDFLQPIKANELLRAARNGPIVVINCHKYCCDALLILPDRRDVSHLSLPNFSRRKALNVRSKIELALRCKGIRERGVHIRREPGGKDNFASALACLWDDIVKPILDFLEYTANVSTSLPHITWCPTGAASFLPLHAAGDYDKPHSRIFDYVVSSYTPTLTALLTSSTPNITNCNSRVLAVGQEATPGHKSLPGTTIELGYVKSHVENKIGYSQLTGAQATPSTVLDAMEQHDWVHLACHAHQNVYDPTKSGFFLHDGILDLAAINRRSFNRKGLAFLSACQTAAGDEALPDEAVHLASGMLMAGYSSVIATMWSVVDEDAPFVADKVYGQLMMDGKLGNGKVGRALYDAIAGLREKVGEMEFGRWVPYIHIGS